MKLFLCLLSLAFVQIGHTQIRDVNKTNHVEQLQQLKQTVSHRIDTLHLQLLLQLSAIDDTHKKLELLKRESSNQDKPDMVGSKDQKSRLQQDLVSMTSAVNKLQKKYDQQLLALDKAVNLQKDLEEKIISLVRETNQ